MSGRRSITEDGNAAGNVTAAGSDTPCTEIAASTRSFGERPSRMPRELVSCTTSSSS